MSVCAGFFVNEELKLLCHSLNVVIYIVSSGHVHFRINGRVLATEITKEAEGSTTVKYGICYTIGFCRATGWHLTLYLPLYNPSPAC